MGSIITVFALVRSGKGGPAVTGAGPTSTSVTNQHTPVPAGLGSTVYTSPASYDDFYAFAWSPDGKYIVSGGGNEAGGNYAKAWKASPLP